MRLTYDSIKHIISQIKFLDFKFSILTDQNRFMDDPEFSPIIIRAECTVPDNDDPHRKKYTRVSNDICINVGSGYIPNDVCMNVGSGHMMGDAHDVAQGIRKQLHYWAEHEVDELLVVNGTKPFHPHIQSDPKLINQIFPVEKMEVQRTIYKVHPRNETYKGPGGEYSILGHGKLRMNGVWVQSVNLILRNCGSEIFTYTMTDFEREFSIA